MLYKQIDSKITYAILIELTNYIFAPGFVHSKPSWVRNWCIEDWVLTNYILHTRNYTQLLKRKVHILLKTSAVFVSVFRALHSPWSPDSRATRSGPAQVNWLSRCLQRLGLQFLVIVKYCDKWKYTWWVITQLGDSGESLYSLMSLYSLVSHYIVGESLVCDRSYCIYFITVELCYNIPSESVKCSLQPKIPWHSLWSAWKKTYLSPVQSNCCASISGCASRRVYMHTHTHKM